MFQPPFNFIILLIEKGAQMWCIFCSGQGSTTWRPSSHKL